MSVEELEQGTAWLLHEAYRWPRVARRFARSLRWGRWFAPLYLLLQNISYRKKRASPWKGGWDPAGSRR